MRIKVKIKPEKIKLALLREGYASIDEFCRGYRMASSTVNQALRTSECTYATAFKLADGLGISADEFVVTE